MSSTLFDRKVAYVNKFIKDITGEKVTCFGKNSHCHWGHSDEEITYKISKIEIYSDLEVLKDDEHNYIDIDIYLKDYHSRYNGFIYTDENFENSIKNIIEKKGYDRNSIDYTEQGAQGHKYVNMELTFPENIINYMKIIPNSEHFENIDMIINYCSYIKLNVLSVDELIKILETTKKLGYELTKIN
jgi:hypothetical protein